MLRSNINIPNKNINKKREKNKMSLLTHLTYEFLPTSDENLLALDQQISNM